MKIPTSTLKDLALDWAVAQCLPDQPSCPEEFRERRNHMTKHGEFVHRWSSSASQAEPIIIDHLIDVNVLRVVEVTERGTEVIRAKGWFAQMGPLRPGGDFRFRQEGSTPIQAAMRCFVASIKGNVVDIPEQLL